VPGQAAVLFVFIAYGTACWPIESAGPEADVPWRDDYPDAARFLLKPPAYARRLA